MPDFDAIARANPGLIEELYQRYREDPRSVDADWALVFSGYEFALRRDGDATPAAPVLGVFDLVHSYRELGHLIADLDPLGSSPRSHPLLRLEEFGFGDGDLDRVVQCGSFRGMTEAPLGDLLEALQETYCGKLGVEFLGTPEKEQREWLQERMEPTRNRANLSADEKLRVLRQLLEAQGFEEFLHTRYVGKKRFSLEGGETLIPLLDEIVEDSSASGVEELVMGMPHRGRLNVLAHILRKPYEMILSEFDGTLLPSDVPGDGDVKYHLGYSHDVHTRAGRDIHLSLSYNPSHLEAINPVVQGIVRAKQAARPERGRDRVCPVLLHGDASFIGQGLVYETLAMSELAAFTTGGTIHVIIDNQIGFTTDPADYLTTRYCSDLARVIQAPVFHVNGDDPESAIQAARLAVGFRQRFHRDVFIHFLCYRRHGHNELDDPSITQPVLYAGIRSHSPVGEIYATRLEEEDLLDDAAVENLQQEVRSTLDDARSYAREFKPRQQVFALGGAWEGLQWAADDWTADTKVPIDELRELGCRIFELPGDFTPQKRVARLFADRFAMIEKGEGIDWGCAENVAYATLVSEGVPLRLTGQDSQRGTFAHRHAVLRDANTGAPYTPLARLVEDPAAVEIVNSLLSEAGVLGFEYGVASANPHRLVVWEAQFGDFANGAQVIIDQFIASGESKWQRMNGIVLLLPHGYEGQGPEHSSARLERFLQLCAEENMVVANPTTPAQIFHLLRRQIRLPFRKPLVVMSPKSLLRHPDATSRLEELADGSFETILEDPRKPPADDVRRLILCSGKIYYALDAERTSAENGSHGDFGDLAITRIEQLYPFPEKRLRALLRRYKGVSEIRWVQEEPANQGAWMFVRGRLTSLLKRGQSLRYVGREEAASPATGIYQLHQSEEQAIVEEALRPAPPKRPARARSAETESEDTRASA